MANRKLAECFLRQLMASMSIITLMGCAGEEVDFSKPPMEIAGGSKPKVDAKDVSAENAASTSPSQRSEPSKQPTDLGSNASSGVSQAPMTDSKRQEIQQPLDDPTDDSQPPPTSTVSSSDRSGKPLASLRSLKSPPSADTTTQGGTSVDKPGQQFSGNPTLLREWERLTSTLPMRWYLSVDSDRRLICCSESLVSVEVLELPPENSNLQLTTTNRRQENTNLKTSVRHMSIWPIQNTLNSLTLVPNKDLVLMATMDGRIETRRFFDASTVDYFAAQSIALQGEMLPGVQAETSGIVFVRMPNAQHVLTVNGEGMLSLWKSEDVCQSYGELKHWADQSSSDSIAVSSTTQDPLAPIMQQQLPSHRVLDFCVNDTQQSVAIITDPGIVSVFSADDLRLQTQWRPTATADTMAVSCVFTSETELACAMLDGSLSLLEVPQTAHSSAAPSSPETSKPPGMVLRRKLIEVTERERKIPICCLMLDKASRLFLGRFDGTVAFLRWPQSNDAPARLEEFGRKQSAAVTSVWRSDTTVWCAGLDRSANLCYADENTIADRNTVDKINLAKDDTLGAGLPPKTARTSPGDETNSGQIETRLLPATASPARTPAADVALTAQPSDRLALRQQHVFRQSLQSDKAAALRTELAADLLTSRDADPEIAATTTDPAPTGQIDLPEMIASKTGERLFLSVSNDGNVVAMSIDHKESAARSGHVSSRVLMWDVPTKLLLRDWKSPSPAAPINYLNDHHCVWVKGDSALLAGDSGAVVNLTSHHTYSGTVLLDEERTRTNGLVLGLLQTGGKAAPAMAQVTWNELETLDGPSQLQALPLSSMELLEGAVTQIAPSGAGASVIAVLRQGNLEKIIEVNSDTPALPAEITRTMLKTEWEPNGRAAPTPPTDGTLVLLLSPSGRSLMTWGIYGGQPTMRFFNRGTNGWSEDISTTIRSSQARLDLTAVNQPAAYIGLRDTRMILATNLGLSVLNVRNAKVEKAIPVPSIDGKRPVTLLSPAGDYAYLGDSDGNVWYLPLPGIDKPATRFSAHTGQIAGMAVSANLKFLSTLGADGRIRVWDRNAIHPNSAAASP